MGCMDESPILIFFHLYSVFGEIGQIIDWHPNFEVDARLDNLDTPLIIKIAVVLGGKWGGGELILFSFIWLGAILFFEGFI